MKFYVVGRWEERFKVREIQAALIQMGFELTVDWTDHEYPTGDLLEIWAETDVNGAREADFIVALMETDHDYKGAWCEIGVALGKGSPVFIIGHGSDSAIMLHHPLVKQFESVKQALNFIYDW